MRGEENPSFLKKGWKRNKRIGRLALAPRFQRTGAKMEQSFLRYAQGFYMQKAEEFLFFGLYQ